MLYHFASHSLSVCSKKMSQSSCFFLQSLHLLLQPLPSLLPLYYSQAVKWMLAYFRALLSNTLSCTGQICGSAECNLANATTSILKQLAWPPTVNGEPSIGSVHQSNHEYHLYLKVSTHPVKKISSVIVVCS